MGSDSIVLDAFCPETTRISCFLVVSSISLHEVADFVVKGWFQMAKPYGFPENHKISRGSVSNPAT
jgi:hypothetical protein